MSKLQHNSMPIGIQAVRRGLVSRLILLLGMLGVVFGALTTAAAQQYPGQGCIATMENRSAFIDANGLYTISNIPVVPGQYTVHIVCPQADGTVLTATSPYYSLQGLTTILFPLFQLSFPVAETQTLILHSLGGTLNALGATIQLETQAILPGGAAYDASKGTDGTTYLTSNPAVATVDVNGVVTATGPGSVTITANNDGLSSTVLLNSFSQLDSDGDGMPDTWEIANGLNPYDPTDAALDPDGDGLTNLQEYQLGTNPHVFDTDGDGLSDGQEISLGTNPLVADTDGDGLTDGQEVALGTNPLNPDTDGDGIPDGIEVKIGTNPLVADVTTTVTGYVTDGSGSPHPGASVVLFTYFTTLSDTTGAFTLLHVPVTLGSMIVSAQAVVGTGVYSGSSKTTAPVGNGTTNVGTITLGPNSGQVSGTVRTPNLNVAAGVQVTVMNGVNTRTTVTDGAGLYAVGGFSAGPVTVAALDPATSLRGVATGALSGTAPLALNVLLGPYGTVSGTVTNAAGVSVGAGVNVTINGALGSSTTTNTLGQYTFSFVPLGPVTMDATDGNGNHGRATGTITATSQTITSNIQYLGRGTVTGIVSDGTGTPVAGSSVRLSNAGLFSQYLTTTTNNVGQYTFANVFVGTLNLSAMSPVNTTGGTATAALTTDTQIVTANISLQATGSISGTVYRANGTTPVSGALVALNGTALTTVTNASGTFTVGNIPLGAYNVLATDASSIDRGQHTVSLTTAALTVPVNLTMVGVGSLTVTVLDGGGNPSPNTQVQVSSGSPFGIQTNGVTDLNGKVTVTPQLASAQLSVFAINPTTGLSSRGAVALAANGTAALTLTLTSAGTIQGTVYQSNAQTPVPGVTVLIPGLGQTTTGPNGTYSLNNIVVGTYSMQVVDSLNNLLGSANAVTVATQGQVVTSNFVIIGRGTVNGQVTNPNGTPAAGVPVSLQSLAGGASQPYGTATDVNGNYKLLLVPVGAYNAIAQSHTVTSNSYGQAAGALTTDGGTTVTNIQLSTTLVPSTVQLTDANGAVYPIRENGGLFDGSYSVFAGDGGLNEGGSLLTLTQGGVTTNFAGSAFGSLSLNGRQLSITQAGIAGLNVTRRIYVPSDGYFARYVELIANPGTQSVTVDVTLNSNLRPVTEVLTNNGVLSFLVLLPHILQTSSGDSTLNIADPVSPDHWVTFGGVTDRDPFNQDGVLDTPIPPIAEIFDGPGATLLPTNAGYIQDPLERFATISETYAGIKVPAGGTVGIMHFLSQENLDESANASAARLVQLPPEALSGLTSVDLGAIQNFVIPSGGTSTLAALPGLINKVSGTVFASDGVTPVPLAPVYLQSTDPIYARTYVTTADQSGNFGLQGAVGGLSIPLKAFNLNAFQSKTTTPATAICTQSGQRVGGGCAILSPTFPGSFSSGTTSAAQNITFSNTGMLIGTVSRGPTVLNVSGTITVSGGSMNSITIPILPDGTYTLIGVLPGTYNVLAQVTNTLLTGLVSATVTVSHTTVANVNIGPAGNIQGTVKRADGSLAVGDIVNLRVPGQSPGSTIVDTAGHYAFTDIPIGGYTVDCFDSLSNSSASANLVVTTSATTVQNLALQSFGNITGTVSANDGSNVSGLTVSLTSTTTNGSQSLTATTNSTGAFTFNQVSPGTIVLHVTSAAGLQGSANGSLPLAGQTVNLNIALIASGTLTGTVLLGDGVTPVAGIQVTLSPAPLSGSAVTTTNASGVYNFQNVYGNFSVAANNLTNGDQGSSTGQIQANGQLRTINITLTGFGSVTVKVTDANGAAVSGAAVTVNGAYGKVYTATSDATGTAQFASVYAGYFSVQVRNPTNGLTGYGSAVLAYNGHQTVTVTLQALGNIVGTVFAPDGVTPQTGAAVQLNAPYGPSTTTAANGTYQFLNQTVGGSYNMTVYDSAGQLRASASSLQLQTAGQTLTQNFTYVGVGSVSGIVLNTDGTRATNNALTVTSQTPGFGGNRSITTAGDGSYSVTGIPVGRFTVTVGNLPSTLAGFGSGTIATDGSSVTLNIQIISSTVALPITLSDADGYGYAIQGDGRFGLNGPQGGINSPFYGAQTLALNFGNAGVYFAGSNTAPTTAIQSLGGQQIEINDPSVGSLNVTRKIYVPSNGYFARRLDVVQNPTSSPVTVTVSIGNNSIDRYSSQSPVVVTTSNGTATVDNSIQWAVDDDDLGTSPYPRSQPAVANVFTNTGAPTGLSTVATSVYCSPFISNYPPYCYSYWNYIYKTVTIPANGTASFLFFSAQEATQSQATSAAQRLVQLPPEALTGLSASDLASIVNFVIPTTQTLTAPTPPPTNNLTGHVYAGDSTTPVPSALVFLQSTDLLYGFGSSAQADTHGAYALQSIAAGAYTVNAVDPATTANSPSFTGTISPPLTTIAQNIIFNNTGIVQGTVKATGATTFPGGYATLYFPCANGNFYCSSANANFGPSGNFTFLTALAGNMQISATINTAQGGTISLPGNYNRSSITIPAQQTTQYTFTLPATGNFTGTVINADGTPAAGIAVYATPSNVGTYETTLTDASGHYSFASVVVDSYSISATDPATQGKVSKVSALVQDATNVVNLTFLGKNTLVATVHFANGNNAQNVQITILTSTTSTYTYGNSYTDVNGQYSFSNIPTGPFTIHAYYPYQNFYSVTTGTVTGNALTQQVAVSLPPVGTISGTVTTSTGVPVSGTYVTIADTMSQYSNGATTDSAGNYAFFPVPADRVVNLQSNLPNNSTGRTILAVAKNQKVPGDAQTLTVNLRYPGQANVQVTVLQANGTPYTSGYIHLVSNDGLQGYSLAMSSAGTATFNNVVEATFIADAYTGNGGYAFGSQIFTVKPTDDGTTVQVTIHTSPKGTVQGTVFAADGVTPIANQLTVSITDIDTGLVNNITPVGGGFSLAGVQNGASGYSLIASLYLQYQNAVTATVTGNITTAGQVDTKNITLPVSSISGTVFLNDGVTPVPNASLYATETLNGNTYHFYNIVSDANGKYQLSGPITGSLTVIANDASSIYGQTTVSLATDTAIITRANISLGPAGMIIGTVYDANHLIVPNIQVEVQSDGANGGFADFVQTDANGNYIASDIAIGNITVTATLPNGTTPTAHGVLSTNGATVMLNIGTSPALGSIFGAVYDQNQNPNPGATVTITAADGTIVAATTDQNGMYTAMSNIKLGAETAFATLSDGTTTQAVFGSVPDNITPVEFDMGLNNPGNVSGTVLDINKTPIPNVRVNLSDNNDPNVSYVLNTDVNGNFDFGQMIPGNITIKVFDPSNVQIGTSTGTLPYGGNVVINVNTMTIGATMIKPQLRRTKPGVEVAAVDPSRQTLPANRLLAGALARQLSFGPVLSARFAAPQGDTR